MFDTQMKKQIFNKWLDITGFEKTAKIKDVDFEKPWWKVITNQKWLIVMGIILTVLVETFFVLQPALLTLIINSQNYQYLVIMCIVNIFILVLIFGELYVNALISSQAKYSVNYWANRFFLTVDPINHSVKSSGTLISKIDRGVNAFTSILDIASWAAMPAIVGTIVSIVTLSQFSIMLGVVGLVSSIVVFLINVFVSKFTSDITQNSMIEVEDNLKSVSVEMLQQNALVRSAFATPEINRKLEKYNQSTMSKASASWVTFIFYFGLSIITIVVTILILGIYIINLISTGRIDKVVGVGLMLTFIGSIRSVNMFGLRARTLAENVISIKDLFTFIRSFGKQTYPVLEGETGEIL